MNLECQKCDLCKTRTKIVCGDGPIPARTMLIGEGPGAEEDKVGNPFVHWARVGAELDRLLAYIAVVPREDIYITHTVKCHCPGDRDPKPHEIAACNEHLKEELALVDPKFIITVGVISTENFLGSVDMEAVHGIPFRVHVEGVERVVIPCYHPGSGLRSPDYMLRCQNDFFAAGKIIKGKVSTSHINDPYSGCEQYNEITDPVRVKDLLENKTLVAVDTETVTRWVEVSARSGGRCEVITPWCVQFSALPGTGYMVRAHSKEVLAALKHHLERPDMLVIIHNALYDLPVLADLDIYPEWFADTMSMAYLLQSEPQGLKALAFRFAGMKMTSYDEMTQQAAATKGVAYLKRIMEFVWPDCSKILDFKKGGEPKLRKPTNIGKRVTRILKDLERKPELDVWKRWHDIGPDEGRQMVEDCLGNMPEGTIADIPLEQAIWYSCRDTDATIRVYPHLWERIQSFGLEETFWRDMRCLPMVQDMGRFGITPDIKKANALSAYFLDKQTFLAEKIQAIAGRFINLNSPKDVKELLFEELKLRKLKKESTGAKALAMLKGDHMVVPLIKQWREYDKLRGTYTSRIQTFVGVDGRIHPTFRITRVPTGRLACSKPNLMAQPVRNEEAKAVRNCYVAEEGFTFVSMDFCVTGDTEVITVNGIKPIRNVVIGEAVLSSREGRSLEFKKVTDTVELAPQQLYEVELMDGSKVRCTGKHKWMVFDGSFVETENLLPSRSLAHVHTGVVGTSSYPVWYIRCAANYFYKHRLVDTYLHGPSVEGFEVDHLNGDKNDWKAANIRRLSMAENHSQGGKRYWKAVKEGSRSDNLRLEKLRIGLKNRRSYVGEENPNYGKRTGKWLNCETCGTIFYRPTCHVGASNFCSYACFVGSTRYKNHKVKSVTWLDSAEPVYCLTVEDTHTFVLANGMVSSNSQIEMRDLAHVSKDPMLLKIFREGLDIHAETASRMFRIPLEQVDENKHRYPAKRVGFGIVYGITAKGLWEQFFMAGLNMKYWTIFKCQNLIDLWYGVYKGVKDYMNETGREARQYGYTRDQFGRIRWVATIHASDERLAAEAERMAGNNPIQSGSQQIIKEAMGLLVPLYRNYWGAVRPLIQIHDDLVFEVRDDLLAEWIPIMKVVMENAIKLDVPILVDCKTGKRWGQLKTWKGEEKAKDFQEGV